MRSSYKITRILPLDWILLLLLLSTLTTTTFVSCQSDTTYNNAAAAGGGKVDLGTTLVAIRYKEGVVVAADTRTSIGSTYVSHRFAHKIVPLVAQNAVICRSGSAADTQILANNQVMQIAELYFHRYGTILRVPQIAQWIVQNSNNGNNEQMSLLLAGTNRDDPNGKTYLYSIAPGGALIEETNFAVAGSGSTYIMAHLDDYFSTMKNNNLLEEGDAVDLCQRVVQMAMTRDGSSGGIIRLFVINRNGIVERTIVPPSSSFKQQQGTKNPKPTFLPGFAAPMVKSNNVLNSSSSKKRPRS